MTKKQKLIIAIDGFASSGKSTLAKDLAKALHYLFIDTGAMYRGIAYFALNQGFIENNTVDTQQLINALDSIEIKFGEADTTERPLLLNGIDISVEIRNPQISSIVSLVAVIPEVRAKLVEMQRELGKDGGIVMDGRDIGTVVFPNADLKLFVTADIKIRAARRFSEMQQANPNITLAFVIENLASRDAMDTSRSTSPLRQAEDAILFDTGLLTRETQLKKALDLAQNLLNA